MVLRFQPLEAGSSAFSFVSRPSEEKPSIDAVSPTAPRWNFLRVKLNRSGHFGDMVDMVRCLGWTLSRPLTSFATHAGPASRQGLRHAL
jgi:hypothetical protein